MKRLLIFMALILLSTASLHAANAPRIIQCGVDPLSVKPGEAFTIYADVADADGFSNIDKVGLMADDQLLMLIPRSFNDLSRFEQTVTMPESVSSATYTLGMLALDNQLNTSDLTYFTFSVTDSTPSVELISPENGTTVDCQGMTVFEWLPFVDNSGGYIFALDMLNGMRITVTLPAQVTSLPVPGIIWSLIPDGQYFWQVGVVAKDGGEPYAWSDLRSFFVACEEFSPTEIFGRVMEKNEEDMTLLVQTRECPDGSRNILIQVTHQTIIMGEEGGILTFEDIELGARIFAMGAIENDVFTAHEIHISQHHQPPAEDHLDGDVIAVDLEQQTITVQGREHHGESVIQVTEDTQIVSSEGPISLEDVTIGDHLAAIGEWDGEFFMATYIMVQSVNPPHEEDLVIGTIVEMFPDAMQFSVTSAENSPENIIVQVTEMTHIMGHHQPLEFGDLDSGMQVRVVGSYDSDLFIARFVSVEDEPGPPDPPQDHVAGEVVMVDVDAMTCEIIAGHDNNPDRITVQANDETQIQGGMGPMTFSDIEVGMHILVIGQLNENFILAEVICIQH
ncbi:hypothetical protein JW823_00575 [bacterium]|nr:hypothetical protein [candidate division CSSED10-310 bacterium]